MAGNSTESGRSVTSISLILLTFTEGTEHSLTEIARRAGLPTSTAHRLTAELTSWRLLERTADGLYRAGRPLRMISREPGHCPSIEERAPCILEDLAAATRRRAQLGVLHELAVAYIERCPGPHRSLSSPGRDPARASHRARPRPARLLLTRHRRDDDPARAAALHPPYRDLTGPVPPHAGHHPAHACGRGPV
jgi:IclR helix-turn-helix domain